jgi:hypothetical protein
MARLFNESRKAPFSGAVSTPHHAPSGEPSVALVAQKTRCGQGGLAQSRTITRFAVPATRAGGRRVGTLPGLCLTDACTVHNGHAHAAPVPPTRREPAQGRTVTRSAIPVRRGRRAARRNPARAVLDRRLYRPQRACSCGTRTPYAPGAGAGPYRDPVRHTGPARAEGGA